MFDQRMQVLISRPQRERLERIAERDQKSIGAVIRDAIDAYTLRQARSPNDALASLFALEAPVADWEQMKAEILAGMLQQEP
jgi:hypothetical protein